MKRYKVLLERILVYIETCWLIKHSHPRSFHHPHFLADYTESRPGNSVSGGETEDESENGTRELMTPPPTTTTTTTVTTLATERTTTSSSVVDTHNTTQPCDSDNGGCDHNCQMVKYYFDPEPIIECSCHAGFLLDENDRRRCHGRFTFFISPLDRLHSLISPHSIQISTSARCWIMDVNKSAITYLAPSNVTVILAFVSISRTPKNVSVSCSSLLPWQSSSQVECEEEKVGGKSCGFFSPFALLPPLNSKWRDL